MKKDQSNHKFLKYLLVLSLGLVISGGMTSKVFSHTNPLSLQLAKRYDQEKSIDIKAYWVSEKLDGVRARWDGEKLFTRTGKIIITPENFTKNWPKITLDGELWLGRNSFDQLSGIVRQKRPLKKLWQPIRFMIFDLPGSKQSFSQRYQSMQNIKSTTRSKSLEVIKQWRVNSISQLQNQLNEVTQKKGEGLMLHHQSSVYKSGRSDDLLKVKKYADTEAIVIKHIEGKGKYKGMMGALLVETPKGLRFKIGTGFTDEQRMTPPLIGCTITYKYFGLTSKGVPRFASFMRSRPPT